MSVYGLRVVVVSKLFPLRIREFDPQQNRPFYDHSRFRNENCVETTTGNGKKKNTILVRFELTNNAILDVIVSSSRPDPYLYSLDPSKLWSASQKSTILFLAPTVSPSAIRGRAKMISQ